MRAASKVGVMYSSPDLREPDDIGTHCSLHGACYCNKLVADPGFQREFPNPDFGPKTYYLPRFLPKTA